MTIDATDRQKEIAAGNVSDGSQHLVTVKENQPRRYEVIRRAFDEALERGEPGVDLARSPTQAVQGGSHEIRTCCVDHQSTRAPRRGP
jgi:hypothetical protein